jgi:histidinol-phosphate aminotransferase
MSLPIRSAILDYRRDSYLNHISSRVDRGHVGATAESGDPEPLIDCAVAYSQWGVSSRVRSALARFDTDRLGHYPERSHDRLLKPLLLSRFPSPGLDGDTLFLGHGCFNLIERVIHKLIRPEVMVGIGPQFNEIPSEFEAAGGSYLAVPVDVEGAALPLAELEATIARSGATVVYVDHPNNPLGLAFDLGDLERLAATSARHGAVVVVDEAYGDFLDDSASAAHLVGGTSNLIVVRSFSKALGLAGERVGYMFMSLELASFYRQVDVPFEPSQLGAVLAAETLQDPGFVAGVRREAAEAKARVMASLAPSGITILPTHESVAIMSLQAPGRDLVTELRRRGVAVLAGSTFVRTAPHWDDSHCRLRIVDRERTPLLCERLASL